MAVDKHPTPSSSWALTLSPDRQAVQEKLSTHKSTGTPMAMPLTSSSPLISNQMEEEEEKEVEESTPAFSTETIGRSRSSSSSSSSRYSSGSLMDQKCGSGQCNNTSSVALKRPRHVQPSSSSSSCGSSNRSGSGRPPPKNKTRTGEPAVTKVGLLLRTASRRAALPKECMYYCATRQQQQRPQYL